MQNRTTLLSIVLGLSLFVGTAHAYPLCFKPGSFLIFPLHITAENFDQYCEVCPWYRKEIEKKIALLEAQRNAEIDYMASVMAYMIGESLLLNEAEADRVLGRKYLQLSYELAVKHGKKPPELEFTYTLKQ